MKEFVDLDNPKKNEPGFIDIDPPKVQGYTIEQREKDAHVTMTIQTTGIINSLTSCFSLEEQQRIFNDPLYVELITDIYEEDAVTARAVDNSGTQTGEFVGAIGNVVKLSRLRDQDAFEELKKKNLEMADQLDKGLKESFAGDEMADEVQNFLKVFYIDKMKRAAKGYSDYYLQFKTPLGAAPEPLYPVINTTTDNRKLQENMKKWGTKFPIYSLAIESERTLQILADYWDEKKGKELSSAKEELYRQKLYDNIVSTSIIYDKVMAATETSPIDDKVYAEGVIQNDAIHINPKSNRGTTVMYSGMEAYKMGLENGWHIEDLGFVAAFHNIVVHENNSIRYNGNTSKSGFKEYKELKYDNPDRPAPGADRKAYIDEITKYYDEVKKTPITTPEKRKEVMDHMAALVRKGVENKCLLAYKKEGKTKVESPLSIVTYFDQMTKNVEYRNKQIEKGKQKAISSKVISTGDRRVDNIMYDLNAPRTDFRFTSENEEHKNLREAMEKLKIFLDNHKGVKVEDLKTKEAKEEYLASYLGKLEAVRHYSKIYQDKKKTASSSGGMQRLNGAKRASTFVNNEIKAISEYLKENTNGANYESIEAFKTRMATNKLMDTYNNLSTIVMLRSDPKGVKMLSDMAADIMVGRIAAAKGKEGAKAFESMGTSVLKENIVKSSEFKSMMKSYLNDKTMTPAKLAEELSGDGALNRLKSVRNNMKKFEENQKKQEAEKQAAAKKAADAKAKKAKTESKKGKAK